MLFSGVIPSLGGPSFGDKYSCSDISRLGMTLFLGREVGQDEDASERFGSR
jgi:hypothetical protein